MKELESMSRTQIEHLINEWVIGLNAGRNRKILKDKYIEGLSIPQIADKYDMSETRVKTVIRTFRRKMAD